LWFVLAKFPFPGMLDSMSAPNPNRLQAPWVQQEARHPDLRQLLNMPIETLLGLGAGALANVMTEHALEEGRGIATAQLPVAQNNHATEGLQILRTGESVCAVYDSRYTGPMGEVARPIPRWGIRIRQGELRYWSEEQHGGNDITLALGRAPGEIIDPRDAIAFTMRWYLGVGLYRLLQPEAAAEFTRSRIPPFDAQARFGKINNQ
jgi:hypothetical protein